MGSNRPSAVLVLDLGGMCLETQYWRGFPGKGVADGGHSKVEASNITLRGDA